MFTVLLGTGCRIGEALGLRWQDLDYDRRTISINHSLSYYQKPDTNKSVLRISKPKTEAGIRTIPMLDVVKDAFEMLYEEQLENGFNETEIDGMSGFIFCNRFGMVPNPQIATPKPKLRPVSPMKGEIIGDRCQTCQKDEINHHSFGF